MKIHFKIEYHTYPGQNIVVCGSTKTLGNWDITKALKLNYFPGGNWSANIDLEQVENDIEYKYCLLNDNGSIVWEWGANRSLSPKDLKKEATVLVESWRAPTSVEKVFFCSAFSKVLMKPNSKLKSSSSRSKKIVRFKIQVPRIGDGYQVCVLGNIAQLGNWDVKKPLLLACGQNFPIWSGDINTIGVDAPIKYKYGMYDVAKKEVVTIEAGADRDFELPFINENSFTLIKSDENFKYPLGNWKGAGVSVPVFSLRSENSFGVGEFNDLIAFIDWAESVGLKMVQLLPINETVAFHNWLDSYPYKSISVLALHPLYLNLQKMGTLDDAIKMQYFDEKRKELNANENVLYPEVHWLKSEYFKLLFEQEKDTFFKQKEYITFFESNKEWLLPYAAFDYFRDKYKSPDFRKWEEFSVYDKKRVEALSKPKSKEKDDILIHYFIQFHLDKQLKEVTNYARKKGVVLKGDIPIGISPNSVEAWTEPHLFNLNAQAGAPPDDFAVKGQNWGFPTYNWANMAEEGYAWWKGRLQKMAEYFDAYRIDHILGFFRIWEIPKHAVDGLLGHFNPALPLTVEEIERKGIRFDFDRMVQPYIPHSLLSNTFGHLAQYVIDTFLDDKYLGRYQLKEAFNTQQKVNQFFLNGIEEEELTDDNRKLRDGLFDLIANVLFVQTGEDQWHPRISIHLTNSYAELDQQTRNSVYELYIDYFYKRHDEFWRQKGMEKLPAIMEASDMLVCGEDLGMVPASVPPVMKQLNILSLEIQRMSKNPDLKFGRPSEAPYLSVCTTSTHDMSTIRGWWEEDRDLTQQFYNFELKNKGRAPFFAEPEICRQIIKQHLLSPAMWTTFPIQDLMAIDGQLRWDNTQAEQINEPSDVRHKWRYRMHLTIDDLKNAEDFNGKLKSLIVESGRDKAY